MDQVFSPTTKQQYTFIKRYPANNIDFIDLPFGDETLSFNTKYRTLEHLLDMSCCEFALLDYEDKEDYILAYVFGHYSYKVQLEHFGAAAVATNKEIEAKHKMPAKIWAQANKKRPLAKKRAKAWRDYFTFKNCVICLDFPYAMTVHKSQGSEFDDVLLVLPGDENHRLLTREIVYTGITRAKKRIIVYGAESAFNKALQRKIERQSGLMW